MTGNTEYDDDWFRFIAAEATRVAHMKKRMLNKYLKRGFIQQWEHHIDHFCKINKNTDIKKYCVNMGSYIYYFVASKPSINAVYHLMIVILDQFLKTNQINNEIHSTKYWKLLREVSFEVFRDINKQRTKMEKSTND